jgi:hypothetical protein
MRALLALALLPVGVVAPVLSAPAPRLELRVSDSVDEGAALRVAVVLDRPAPYPVRVRLDTRRGEARGRVDYTPVHEVLTIPAGRDRVVVAVEALADGRDERDESFVLRLSAAENAVLTADRSVVTIVDRDRRPRVLVDDGTVVEPSTRNQLGYTHVHLSEPSGRRVVVQLSSRPGTATVADFVPLHPTTVFAPGESTQLVSVEVLPDDLVEGPETVRLVVTSARHARPPSRAAVITIDDADD